MARILITTLGHLGSWIPLLALSEMLRSRGQDLRIAANPAVSPLFDSFAGSVVECGPRFGPVEAARDAAAFDVWSGDDDAGAAARRRFTAIPWHYRDLRSEVRRRRPDLVITGAAHTAARLLANDHDIPCVVVHTAPGALESEDGSAPAPALRLVICSAALTSIKRAGVVQTGAWRRSEHPLLDAVSTELANFVDVDPRDSFDRGPIALLLGSHPVADVTEIVALHADVTRALGRKLIVQYGWSRPPALSLDPSAVMCAPTLPHAWLLARSAALIFHGGLGLAHQALIARCPMLIEPRTAAQAWTASRLTALSAACALHPRRLTRDGLARCLEARVLVPEVLAAMRPLATIAETERGVADACDNIEALLASGASSSASRRP